MLRVCYRYSLKTRNWLLKIYDTYKGLYGVKKEQQQIGPSHPSEMCELSEGPEEVWREPLCLPVEEDGELGGTSLGETASPLAHMLSGNLNTFC